MVSRRRSGWRRVLLVGLALYVAGPALMGWLPAPQSGAALNRCRLPSFSGSGGGRKEEYPIWPAVLEYT